MNSMVIENYLLYLVFRNNIAYNIHIWVTGKLGLNNCSEVLSTRHEGKAQNQQQIENYDYYDHPGDIQTHPSYDGHI